MLGHWGDNLLNCGAISPAVNMLDKHKALPTTEYETTPLVRIVIRLYPFCSLQVHFTNRCPQHSLHPNPTPSADHTSQ